MKVHFFLRFQTRIGQELRISGNLPALGNDLSGPGVPMQYHSDQFWHFELDCDTNDKSLPATISYHYMLAETGAESIREWGEDRAISWKELKGDELQLMDTWNHAGEFQNVFYSAPFRKVLLPQQALPARKSAPKNTSHIFKVKHPLLGPDEKLCISGSCETFGAWDAEKSLAMHPEGDWWVLNANLSKEDFPMTYKYGVWNSRDNRFERYEDGNNRILYDTRAKKKVTILHDGFAQLPNNTWRGSGIAIPVFSLRSRQSFGIGEFTDIRLLVDWSKKLGMRMIQLLPVNDTISTRTWMDSYPYSAISAFALHPVYLNLDKVAGKDYKSSVHALHKKQKQLNALPDVDYEAVLKLKWDVIEDLYALLNEKVFASADYVAFYEQNKYWLQPYAAFCYLRDKYKTPDFTRWKQHGIYDEKEIAKLCDSSRKHHDRIAIHYFTQYHLHLQLQEAHEYANRHGIILKGDIPIGINRYGVDAWMEPALYNMDTQAGAPPDDFAVRGQNWSFPTYNWEKMQLDGFSWWKQRFGQMSRYFDAFRIDHILGFFRIWSIPCHAVEGIMGHFVPAIPVDVREFHERDIWFDHHRYCTPYINDAVLWEAFGPLAEEARAFVDPEPWGTYRLKPAFDTQRKVEAWYASQEKDGNVEQIRQGLFDLISNVILFEDRSAAGEKFHFRFSMESTASFRQLPGDVQHKLRELYVHYFFRRQDEFWKREAMQKLPALKRCTDMLICGEDLGLVPACVPDVMKQLGILSLEIQRMPKDPKREFFHPNDAPYLSVVTPSTHDMSTVRGWWEEDADKTQHFYTHELGQYGPAPQFCEPWISKAILLQHLFSPAQWAVFQFQDLMGISGTLRRENPQEERINVPSNPKHYWRYRMHIPLEDLLQNEALNEEINGYIQSAGRL
jgi:4-alpha-glucanotransferase